MESKSVRPPRKTTTAKTVHEVLEMSPVSNGDAPAPSADVVIQKLIEVLSQNLEQNTRMLARADQRGAQRTDDREAGVEQLRTILNYRAIGQMMGRAGDVFQKDNLVSARRSLGNPASLALIGVPDGVAKVSVQVDGAKDPEVITDLSWVGSDQIDVVLGASKGRDIGRIELLAEDDRPLRVGPRMVAPRSTRTRTDD